MKKYGFLYEEKLTFLKELRFETDLTEEEVFEVLDNAERTSDTFGDIAFTVMEHPKINVLDGIDEDYSSPTEMEIEYYDHKEIKEENK